MKVPGSVKTLLRPFKRATYDAAWEKARSLELARVPHVGWFHVPSDFNMGDYKNLWKGDYEKAESSILAENFQPADMIIEVGANIGVVSRMACKSKLMPDGTMVCIEANPKSIPYLETNLAESARAHDIRVLQCAIGAPGVEGELQIFSQRQNLSSGLMDNLRPEDGENIIDVPVFSLSSIVGQFEKARSAYSLICDAEGAEITMLQKDPEAFRSCNQIAIELHHPRLTGSDVTPRDMIDMFSRLGFRHERELHDTHYFRRITQQASPALVLAAQ